ncbi:hypothetical protein RIF23_07595 [Lipingzhangella sp. LS1_29]|uniref:Uncharacterized protein n=1 Tax=Lipingzhangella rawalii TaxID=2055835 RepID=A0ABU2H5Q4_9ACTN|nr:hypothetical protein [Lipingzhangella rawalii]MDS1270155.1 hypothetical protein [Lipingzhangella rawalii]
MSDQHVGLTEGDALSRGGEGLGQESEGLYQQLQSLIDDISERDGQALQGSALAKFQQARTELTHRFDELIRWCNNNGIDLNEGQRLVNTTDEASADDFGGAQTELGGLTRAIN